MQQVLKDLIHPDNEALGTSEFLDGFSLGVEPCTAFEVQMRRKRFSIQSNHFPSLITCACKQAGKSNSSCYPYIREYGSTLYVGLARAVPPTNTNFQPLLLPTQAGMQGSPQKNWSEWCSKTTSKEYQHSLWLCGPHQRKIGPPQSDFPPL